LLAAAGCSESADDASDAGAGPSSPLEDAGDDVASDAGHDAAVAVGDIGPCGEGLGLCDIREADCQETIARVVGCLRESSVPMPPVRLISEAEYAQILTSGSGGGSANLAAAVQLQRWIEGLALFGLAEPGVEPSGRADDRASRIAATYLYATRDIAVIDRGMPFDDLDAVTTLAHELVHAQQDQERDLLAWNLDQSTSEDRALAATAVIEGEATHYAEIVRLALRGDALEAFDWPAMYAEWQGDIYQGADEQASPYLTAGIYFPYAFGGEMVTNAWLKGGPDGVAALYDQPPLSTHEILFDAEGELEAQATLHDAAGAPFQAPYAPVTLSNLGSWMVRAFLRRAGFDPAAALAAAATVGADMFSVQVNTDDETFVAGWRMVLVPGADASWVDELVLLPPQITWSVDGDVLTIVSAPPDVAEFLLTTPWLPIRDPAQ
jgi:hypothetical protein